MSFRHTPRRPETVWILVADRATGRIFTADDPDFGDIREIVTLVSPEGAAHPRDVLADRPGRFPGQSGECVAGDPETDYRHRTAQEFACRVVEALEGGRMHDRFGGLVVIAPALFLGVLRKHLPSPLKKLVIGELSKELAHANPDEIARQALGVLNTSSTEEE